MALDKQTGKLIARIAENLPDMNSELMQKWIDDPKSLQAGLRQILLSTPEVLIKPDKEALPLPIKVWKTIRLGTGLRTADDFRRALRDGGHEIDGWASDLLGQPAFTAATEEVEVDLVRVTNAELGFKDGARRDQTYERARQFGLALCPAEVGPQLRLQYPYPGQPSGEWLLVGMEPIAGSSGHLGVFYVRRGDLNSWLSVHYGFPGYFWGAGGAWVFVLPRPSTKARENH